MLGASIEEAISPACALELIHTYSLIHDDLPCMDDDDMRRGKPTVHKIYGEGHAVLTGDFLLTHAFEVLSDAPFLSSEKKIELIRLLARQAGGDGMVGGQALDLMSEGKELSWDTLNFIHHHKTAALIGAAIEFGAIIAGANHQDRDLLRSIGYEAGLSFQIIDDILDVTGDEKTLGKPILSDIYNNKSTAVTILGMEQAKAMAEKLLASVERKTKSLSFISSTFQMLLSSLTKRHF
jgi:geranylgeranyl diphosphate synthase type II